MKKGIDALKAAARRATNGQWPYVKNYNLKTGELQRLMVRSAALVGKYRVISDRGEYVLAYRP